MTQAHNTNQLLDITLREISTDPHHLLPMANSFIDQWVRALGAGHELEDNVASELEQLKHALAEGKPLPIGESLHSLAKLAKKGSGETDNEALSQKLQGLADALEGVAVMAGRKKS
ncbi:hypothetical protein [Tellurirhabdus bombi]|uniref:hypothetical protein n=1 Tax=Tellurirhabdus bombi TaxID=2907205 RepID=UPI001F36E599|nr:hypothetical protein [Tellurirhabdus bombi]